MSILDRFRKKPEEEFKDLGNEEDISFGGDLKEGLGNLELEEKKGLAGIGMPEARAPQIKPQITAPIPENHLGFDPSARFPKPVGLAESEIMPGTEMQKPENMEADELRRNMEILNSKLDMLKVQLDTINQALMIINAKIR